MEENIFARKLREMEEGKEPEPFTHEPVPAGKKRVLIESIEVTTEKARLIVIMGTNKKVWVPKSVSKLQWGNEKRGVSQEDKSDVMDIDQDFYDQTIA